MRRTGVLLITIPFVPFLALLALFLFLGARDFGEHDSGEIAAGAATLGIVHPPGYPLYLLVGHLLFRLGGIRGLLLLSSVPAVAALFLLTRLAVREGSRPAQALAAAFLLGLTPLFLDFSLQIEVYGLYFLFLVLLETFIRDFEAHPVRFFLTLSLALSHHIGLLILLPAYLPEILSSIRRRPRAAGALGVLPLGPLLYLLLPVWSNGGADIISWGPVTFAQLPHYATGGPFRVWLFQDPLAGVLSRIGDAASLLFLNFPLLLWPLMLLGLASRRGSLAPTSRALWFLCVPILHLGVYHVIDFGPFLTPCLLPLALALARGLEHIRNAVSEKVAEAIPILAVLLTLSGYLFSPFLSMAVSLPYSPHPFAHPFSFRSTYPAEYARAVLTRYPSGTTLRANWRYFPLLRALQIVEKRGPGVIIRFEGRDTAPIPVGEIALTPTSERGETSPLVFDGLAWRAADAVETRALSSAARETRELLPGLVLCGAELPTEAVGGREEGTLLTGRIFFRRSASTAPDSFPAALSLRKNGLPLFTLPMRPIAWHLPPARWDTDVLYVETVGAHLGKSLLPGEYVWVLRTKDEEVSLGRLVLTR